MFHLISPSDCLTKTKETSLPKYFAFKPREGGRDGFMPLSRVGSQQVLLHLIKVNLEKLLKEKSYFSTPQIFGTRGIGRISTSTTTTDKSKPGSNTHKELLQHTPDLRN